MTSRRHGSRTHTIHTDTYRPGRQVFSSLTHTDTQLGRGGGGGTVQEMVLQGYQAEIPAKKLKRGHKKKFLAEFWLILPKTGRKGAAENIQKKFLFFSCDNCDKFDF